MRGVLAGLAVSLAALSASADPVVITIDSDGDDQIEVMEVDESRLDDIAHTMHEQYGRCGGFMRHDSLAEAEATVELFSAERLELLKDKRPVDYTLDRPLVVRGLLQLLDKQRIHDTIVELQGMGSRYFKSATGTAASTWLAARWRTFTDRRDVIVELVKHDAWPQHSVVMTIPGTTRANEVIVIGGHLDSISLVGRSSNAPGADDDASGIATLTEIARVLLAADYRPERTIKFMAYAAEEVGLRGSQAIATDYKKRGINVVGALQLDMTNYQGSAKDIWLMKDFTSAPQNEFLIRLIDTYVGATWGMDACGYACSDHASWTRIGVPASMPFEARMADRNKHIHTAKDTLETSGNNADHALKFARLGAAYAIELGKGGIGPSHAVTASASASCTSTRKLVVLGLLAALAAAGLLLQRRVTG